MLVEREVVDSVEAFLTHKGYQSVSRAATTHSHGMDLAMRSPRGTLLCIEAKGQTSERAGSKRFGKEFDQAQKTDHLGAALARVTLGISRGEHWAVALPGDDFDRALVRDRKKALGLLGLACFLVNTKTHAVTVLVGEVPP